MDVMKTALAKSRRKVMASSSRPPVQQEREVERVSTSEVAGLPVWASKPSGGRFVGLDLKIGGVSGAAKWRLWRARGVIAKLASR